MLLVAKAARMHVPHRAPVLPDEFAAGMFLLVLAGLEQHAGVDQRRGLGFAVEETVLRLDVAMNEAALVQSLDRQQRASDDLLLLRFAQPDELVHLLAA